MKDELMQELGKKSKEELIAIIAELGGPKKKEPNLSDDSLVTYLEKIKIPAWLTDIHATNILLQNSAAQSLNLDDKNLLTDLNKRYGGKSSLPFSFWSNGYGEEHNNSQQIVYVQEYISEPENYLLITLIPEPNMEVQSEVDLKDHYFLNTALNLHQIGVWYFDLKRDLGYLNHVVQFRLGLSFHNKAFSAEELIEMLHPDDRKVFHKLRDTLVSIKGMFTFKGRLMHTITGEILYSSFMFFPIVRKGEVVALWGTIKDAASPNTVDSPSIMNSLFSRQIDRTLRKKNNILTVLESNVKVAWWHINQEKTHMDFSDNWEQVVYLERERFLKAEDYLNIVHPDDRDSLAGVIESVFSGAPYTQCSYRMVHPDKPMKHIYGVNMILDQEIYGIIHDITDLRMSEINLKETEATYKEVVDSLDEMIIRCKPDTTLTFVNEAYARFFHTTKEALIGTKVITQMPEYLQREVLRKFEDLAINKKTLINQYKIADDAGDFYWHRITDYPILDEQGELKEIQSIGIDITEKMVASNKLSQSEQKYRMLAEGSSDIIFWLDQELNISYINPAVFEMLGYDSDEASTLSLEELTSPLTVRQIKKYYEMDGHSPVCYERKVNTWKTKMSRKDGSKIWGELVTSTLTDEEGNFSGLMGIVRDISKRKKYEDQLIKANKELATLIEEKNKFISMVSHDFKTPLNSLVGMVYLLKNKLNPIPQNEILDTLNFSSNHLKLLVNNLLDLSKLQQRKINLEQRNFSLSWLLKNCVNTSKLYASDKSIQFSHEFVNTENIELLGDPDRLYQIFNNLLSNAIKFTDDGKVNFMLRVGPKAKGVYTLEAVIEDTGTGIEERYLDRIFEPYVQIHTSNKEGSGCGLSIVKELVDLFHGNIEVESKLHHGSRFTLKLDLPAAIPVQAEAVDERSPESVVGSLEGLNVLYVEDLEFNQKLAEAYAELWKFDLHVVDNAEEAISLLREQTFDIVLMDIFLPGLQGDEATSLIRSEEKLDKIPGENIILAVTALDDVTQPEWQAKYGFNDVVPKPIDPTLLYKKLKEWSNKKSESMADETHEEDMYQPQLFQNLKSSFTQEPANFKTLLRSFQENLKEQVQALNAAIENMDITAYRQSRHNLTGMLAMMNEGDLRQCLNKHRILPDKKKERKEVQDIINTCYLRLQNQISREVAQ